MVDNREVAKGEAAGKAAKKPRGRLPETEARRLRAEREARFLAAQMSFFGIWDTSAGSGKRTSGPD
jgi:hypothetical protein